jgi:hypothetical protein
MHIELSFGPRGSKIGFALLNASCVHNCFAEAKRCPVLVGMMLYHEAYVTSEAVPKPALAVPERD